MLKTNCKKVMERVKKHVMDYYEQDKDALLHDSLVVGGGVYDTNYQRGVALARGGCFICYNWQANQFLKEVLSETDAEAEKFLQKSFDLYCHLIGRAVEKILNK